MTWVDVLIPLVLAGYIFRGVRRGFIISALELAAFGLSLLLAVGLCRPVGGLLQAGLGVAPVAAPLIGLLVAWVVILSALLWGVAALRKRLPSRMLESPWNTRAGSIPAAIEAVILIALVLTLLVALPLWGVPKSAIISSALGRPLVEVTYRFETALSQRIGGPSGAGLRLVTIEPERSQPLALRVAPSRLTVIRSDELDIYRRINAERTSRGLPALTLDPDLTRLARAYARQMFAAGYFGHTAPDGSGPADRMTRARIDFDTMGENLALAPTASIAHHGLMSSPGHRANILSPEFRRIGIGALESGIYGTMYVQEFAG